MSQAIISSEIQDMLNINSSVLPDISIALLGKSYAPLRNGQFDPETFEGNYLTHSSMMKWSANRNETMRPICYVRLHKYALASTVSSSGNLSETIREYYENLEGKLLKLAEENDEVRTVEEGAIKSALSVIDQLKKYQLAPPELSWNGGDAVVMLWSIGDTTYAITVTDGELGYVVRRNRKAIKMVDSISLSAFRLGEKI